MVSEIPIQGYDDNPILHKQISDNHRRDYIAISTPALEMKRRRD